ncbi:MAG: translocation/assembly module TamB domain-containing protein [Bacteroidales bacterium]|nr:translocation/assembly module TamB domain-containing protein [Bacteroidales bacterium]
MLYVLTALALLLAGAVVSLQLPQVQNFALQQALHALEGRFDGDLTVGGIQLQPDGTLVLTDVVLTDSHPYEGAFFEPVDTLARIGTLVARFNPADLFALRDGSPLVLQRAEVEDAELTLISENRTSEKDRTNLMRVFHIVPHNNAPQAGGNILDIREAVVRNFHFRMLNTAAPAMDLKTSMNWADLDIVANARARDIRVRDGMVYVTADEASLTEKCGYTLRHADARVEAGMGRVRVRDVHFRDDWSDLDIPLYAMDFYNNRSFWTFTDSVRMKAVLAPGHLDFKTLGAFVYQMDGIDMDLDLQGGSFEGTAMDWKLRELDFEDRSGVKAILSADVSGLKDIKNADIKLDVNHLKASAAQLEKLFMELPLESTPRLAGIAGDKPVTFRGRIEGQPDDLTLSGKFSSPMGSLSTSGLKVRGLTGENAITVRGPIASRDLDVSAFLSDSPVHECTMNAGAAIKIAQDNSISARLDSLKIDRLNVLDYDYSDIAAAGSFEDGAFNGKVICSDPNLNFIFQGIVNLSKEMPNAIYKFYFNLGYADLQALNLDQRGTSKLALALNANYMRIARGDLIGEVEVKNINVENDEGRQDIQDISIVSHSNNSIHRINMSSSFMDANYVGSRPLGDMIADLENLTLKRELPSLYRDPSYEWNGENYRVNVQFHDSRSLLRFIMPGLYIADGTSLNAELARSGNLVASVKSPRLAFNDKYIKDLELKVGNKDGRLTGRVEGGELSVGGLVWKNNALELQAISDSLALGLRFGDTRLSGNERGDLSLGGRLERDEHGVISINGRLKPSYFIHNDQLWNLTPAQFQLHPEKIGVKDLDIYGSGQHIMLDGTYNTAAPDTLRADIRDFDLAKLDELLGTDLNLSGLASGNARLVSPLGTDLDIAMDLVAEDCAVGGQDAGTLLLSSLWNHDSKSLDFSLRDSLKRSNQLHAYGSFSPSDRGLQAKVFLDSLNLAYLTPFISNIMEDISGSAKGEFSVAGTLDELSVYSREAAFRDFNFRVVPTGVAYTLNGPFHMDDSGLYFDSMGLGDGRGGSATIDGALNFDHLKDFRMNAAMAFNRLQVFDNMHGSSMSFYGDLAATGQMIIEGPMDALRIDIDAATAGDGRFYIPLGGASNSAGTNLLTFTDHTPVVVDPYEEMIQSFQKEEEKTSGDLVLHMDLDVNDLTECVLEIDKNSGNAMSGRGAGTLTLDLIPSQNIFNIGGDYTLSSGNYHFAALGITTKDFDIQSGSSIKFEGDIMSSVLDIDALYTTKTSLSTLIADTTSVSTRRVVECGIHIFDRLSNPQLSFSINVPDLDPSTKSMVESALNTEDKIQKQFLSLLVANSFIPDEQSGIVNNTSLLYSNVASIMAGQLNNILQQLDIPLDLGLTYQPTESGADIFDVAVSTQLFNNRVVINGAIGNRQYTGTTGDEVVGDLDIEVKLNRSGSFRGTLFSHSVDQYTNFLDNSQRNGVGLAYQKEFNTFGEFFRSLWRRRRDETPAEEKKTIITVQ